MRFSTAFLLLSAAAATAVVHKHRDEKCAECPKEITGQNKTMYHLTAEDPDHKTTFCGYVDKEDEKNQGTCSYDVTGKLIEEKDGWKFCPPGPLKLGKCPKA
ncbi:hypothetical protein B0H11DRAFT_2271697 [Mycena galericulata]|nr:hypothetical protein B0H11DRAFT_2271697 [Mycena galericulata]